MEAEAGKKRREVMVVVVVTGRESGGEERERFLLHCSRDITHDIEFSLLSGTERGKRIRRGMKKLVI